MKVSAAALGIALCSLGAGVIAQDDAILSTEDGSLRLRVAEGKSISFDDEMGDPVTVEGIRRFRRDVECDRSLSEEMTAIVTNSTTFTTVEVARVVAESMAEVTAAVEAAGGTSVVAVFDNCNATGCSATGGSVVTVVVQDSRHGQAPLVRNLPIYTCAWEASHTTVTSAPSSSADGFSVECAIPRYDSADIPEPEWNAAVTLLRGDVALPYTGATNFPTTKMVTVGPTIAPIDAIRFSQDDVADGPFEATLEIGDADTAPGDLEVTAASPSGRLAVEVRHNDGDVWALLITPTGEDRIESTVVVTVTDNHGRTATRAAEVTFGSGCESRLKLVHFNGKNGAISGQWGVSRVETLHRGVFKIHFETPFEDTNYAVAGVSAANGNNGVHVNVEPHGNNGVFRNNLDGQPAVDQFLHTDYIVVSLRNRNNDIETPTGVSLVMLRATDDDGCDNTGITAATWTTKANRQPNVRYSYGVRRIDKDCPSQHGGGTVSGWAVRRSRSVDGAQYGVGGITDATGNSQRGYSNANGGGQGMWMGLEGSGSNGYRYNTYKPDWFCPGQRQYDNNAPRYTGQFSSVIAFEERPGVKIAGISTRAQWYWNKGFTSLGRSGNQIRISHSPNVPDDNFALLSIANMWCSGGEQLVLNDGEMFGRNTQPRFRSVYHNGNSHTSTKPCGFATITSIHAETFVNGG